MCGRQRKLIKRLSLCVCARASARARGRRATPELKLKYRGRTGRLLEYYEDYLSRGARSESGNSSRFNLPSRLKAPSVYRPYLSLCDNVRVYVSGIARDAGRTSGVTGITELHGRSYVSRTSALISYPREIKYVHGARAACLFCMQQSSRLFARAAYSLDRCVPK